MTFSVLPQIMVAPNGARKSVADHAALPVSIGELVSDARQCFAAGAGGLHAHVRDASGAHVLDAGLYHELLSEMAAQIPKMLVQITTEAVGRYSPEQQMQLVRSVKPRCVSIALREMTQDQSDAKLRAFYHELNDAQVNVQHILYSPEEIGDFATRVSKGVIPRHNAEVLVVLGRYEKNQQSTPADLVPFMAGLQSHVPDMPWAVCAFGHQETACLVEAAKHGGKQRIGFENNLFNSDGTLAENNAQRVSELVRALGADQ
ncbi:3-keto-5-aminohexanoate cleavage protein [Pelagimonas varians]|uniref:3-keto-5-aminohexanoate cleavage enzyme n=1 Tax=Pelagimonas varians TaxID=696760 RepID=A0A238KBM8_9RHOB|nr:3-keto-5-aminohexanoate cleavage protein [Pelagimonas varians]PYG31024.1 uncharacterized protein (DUF849 family) [Pelagimonas varians]SMX39456.1 3-keto-5-aminohexanoate cleavage enzyme [Pelagimonas varians]